MKWVRLITWPITLIGVSLITFILIKTNGNSNKSYQDCLQKWPGELCAMLTPETQAELYKTCSQAKIPQRELDTGLYLENKIAKVSWRDTKRQEEVVLYLPYEPETGFAGCSASAKSVLQHLKDTQVQAD